MPVTLDEMRGAPARRPLPRADTSVMRVGEHVSRAEAPHEGDVQNRQRMSCFQRRTELNVTHAG